MFRIVRFVIEEDKLLAAIERQPHMSERLQRVDWGTTHLKGQGSYMQSQRMSTTSAQFFEVEQYLRSMFGDPSNLVEDVTSEYRLLRTRAPKNYDYGYVIEIATMEGEFGPERLVAMPKESVDYQSGRYASGMYTPILCS